MQVGWIRRNNELLNLYCNSSRL